MSSSYVVYFLDGPKKGETVTVEERAYYIKVGIVVPLPNDVPSTSRIEYVLYHIHEVDSKLFALCDESELGFANLVAKALVEHTSGLLDEATRQLQTISNELDRGYDIVADGAIHGDVSEFLEKVRQYNE